MNACLIKLQIHWGLYSKHGEKTADYLNLGKPHIQKLRVHESEFNIFQPFHIGLFILFLFLRKEDTFKYEVYVIHYN